MGLFKRFVGRGKRGTMTGCPQPKDGGRGGTSGGEGLFQRIYKGYRVETGTGIDPHTGISGEQRIGASGIGMAPPAAVRGDDRGVSDLISSPIAPRSTDGRHHYCTFLVVVAPAASETGGRQRRPLQT